MFAARKAEHCGVQPSIAIRMASLEEPCSKDGPSFMGYRNLLFALALVGLPPAAVIFQQAQPQRRPAPTVTSGKDGIFSAFQTHPLVGLGDVHGFAQEEDFFVSLIRDPRFARNVGNVVVEFGDAAQQQTIDRFVDGDDVPYEQLRKVWSDTLGWVSTVTSLGYMNFFAAVREVNLKLPPTQRIHVWLGDPPVDWSKIETRADLSKLADRNQFPAKLIESTILAKGRKALILYGVVHFFGDGSLGRRLEQAHPGALFVVTPYFGFTNKSCSDVFERAVRKWPSVALATPVRGSSLEHELRTPGCHFVDASSFTFDKTATEAQKANAITRTDEKVSGIEGDALLYLGPADELTQSPLAPDLYLDLSFRKEIGRRFHIITGGSLTWPSAFDNSVSLRYLHPYGGIRSEEK